MDRLDEKTAIERVARCPVCQAGEDRFDHFATQEDEGWIGVYLICRACGLVFQSPRPTNDALVEFYEEEYLESTLESEEDARRDRWIQQQRAAHLADFVSPYIESLGIHLDVGASRGTLMRELHARYACRSLGVEPGLRRRERASAQGLEMVADIDSLPEEINGRVDLVTMAHTLEHLKDPVAELSRIRSSLLSLPGWLLIEVPNLLCHEALERAHLYAFTRDSLRRTLRAAGFETVKLVTHGNPHSRRFPLYVLILARGGNGGDASVEELRVGVSPLSLRVRRSAWRRAYGASYWVWVVKSLLTGRKPPPWSN